MSMQDDYVCILYCYNHSNQQFEGQQKFEGQLYMGGVEITWVVILEDLFCLLCMVKRCCNAALCGGSCCCLSRSCILAVVSTTGWSRRTGKSNIRSVWGCVTDPNIGSLARWIYSHPLESCRECTYIEYAYISNSISIV